MTEDEMFGWHHRLSGHEFEQTLGDGEGQGRLQCFILWGHKESFMTERLHNNSHRIFGTVSQSYLRCYLLGYSPHFVPNET